MGFVRALGAEPRVIGVDAHDRLLAFLSHLPQLTASALMQVVGDAVGPEGLALAGRGLADTTRLASSPADIWKDIAATNGDEIASALDALIGLLQDLLRDLRVRDPPDEQHRLRRDLLHRLRVAALPPRLVRHRRVDEGVVDAGR